MSAHQTVSDIDPGIDDLFDYASKGFYLPRRPRRPKKAKISPPVIAEWPAGVTEAELDLLEIHLADVLDEIFGPKS